MSRTGIRAGRALALVCVALLAVSSASAQSSNFAHVPARTAYPSPVSAGAPAFRIYPGDRGFQATMKIAHYYQNAERSAGAMSAATPRYAVTAEPPAATPVAVTIPETEGPTEMVNIRGPDGKVRSFPIKGGRAAIKTRTIVVHPGEQLHLVIRGGRVEVRNK